MRCKVGDLCIVVGALRRSDPNGARGCVAEIVGHGDFPADWLVVIPNKSHLSETGKWNAYDTDLLPIRDNDGEDEILRIAGRPVETVRQALEAIREAL